MYHRLSELAASDSNQGKRSTDATHMTKAERAFSTEKAVSSDPADFHPSWKLPCPWADSASG
jgi:hypothetical protein